jgi:hypothetical protein
VSAVAVVPAFPYVWRWRRVRPERYLRACRIVAWPDRATRVTVEFEDGERVEAARSAVRAARTKPLTP